MGGCFEACGVVLVKLGNEHLPSWIRSLFGGGI